MNPDTAAVVAARVEAGLSRLDDLGQEIAVRPVETVSERIARIRAAAEERDNAERAEMSGLLARMLARAGEAQEYRQSLPCYALEPAEGAAVCDEVAAHRACALAHHPNCPRRLQAAPSERRRLLLEAAGVPARYADRLCSTGPLAPTPALALARKFITTTPRPWLVAIAGPKGIGKSMAGCWALGEEQGRYLAAPDLERLDFDPAPFHATRLLVLDELGQERASDYVVGRVQALLQERYAEQRPTLVTTNLPRRGVPGAFAERYGERLDDRVNEGGRYVGLAGESLRGKG